MGLVDLLAFSKADPKDWKMSHSDFKSHRVSSAVWGLYGTEFKEDICPEENSVTSFHACFIFWWGLTCGQDCIFDSDSVIRRAEENYIHCNSFLPLDWILNTMAGSMSHGPGPHMSEADFIRRVSAPVWFFIKTLSRHFTGKGHSKSQWLKCESCPGIR